MSTVPALGNERFSSVRPQVNVTENIRRFAASALSASSRAICSVWGLMICKAIILFVSALDIYLTIKYVEFLPQLELNPVGRWLLSFDNGPSCSLQNAAAFITAKFAGNVVVLAVIELLVHCKFRKVSLVVCSVTLFQILLGLFLMYADFSEV